MRDWRGQLKRNGKYIFLGFMVLLFFTAIAAADGSKSNNSGTWQLVVPMMCFKNEQKTIDDWLDHTLNLPINSAQLKTKQLKLVGDSEVAGRGRKFTFHRSSKKNDFYDIRYIFGVSEKEFCRTIWRRFQQQDKSKGA